MPDISPLHREAINNKLRSLVLTLCDLQPQTVSLSAAYCAAADRYSEDPQTEALIYGAGKLYGNLADRIGDLLQLVEELDADLAAAGFGNKDKSV